MTVPARPRAAESSRLILRPMIDTDVDPVAEIESLAAAEPWTRSHFVDELCLPEESRHWVVAAADRPTDRRHAVVGFGGIMVVADEAHIMNVAVHPDVQGRGIGRLLVSRLLSAGVKRGARSATLEVRPDNDAALRLYRAIGFRRNGRRRRYYRDGSDAVIMWAHDLRRFEP